jgi:membrane protease YdiL (CAAX protease family)
MGDEVRARLRTPMGACTLGLLATVLAWLEHTWGPWRPFYVVYATACIAVPLWLGTARLSSPPFTGRRWFRWAGWVGLAFALQLVAGLWIAVLVPAIQSGLGAPADRLGDVSHSLAAALPAAISTTADVWNASSEGIFFGYVVFITVWAGFGEEVFYRGYIQEVMQRGGALRSAVVVSAALFAVRHAVQLALLPVYPWSAAASWVGLSFVLGLVFSWIYLRTGSLWPCVVVHTAFNVIPLLQLSLA